MKRYLIFSLVLVLLVSVTSSFGVAENEIQFPLDETVSFTAIASINSQGYKLAEKPVWKYLEDKTNVHIELTEVPNAEAVEKINLILSGGNYPDLVYRSALPIDTINKYGMDGVLIPLEDLIRDYAPNLTRWLDEKDAWSLVAAPDGHIYSFPYFDNASIQGMSLWLNEVWMNNLGLDEPHTLDDLYTVLKAFKEEDANKNGDPNDELPFVLAATNCDALSFLRYLEDGVHFNTYLLLADGELSFYPISESFKDDFLARLAKWYEEGIIYENSFTQTYEQFRVLGKTGDIYGMFIHSGIDGCCAAEYCTDYITYKPAIKENLPKNTGISNGGLAITDACKNPEIITAWVDYFYTEEGCKLTIMGIEGENYIVNDDGTFDQINLDTMPVGSYGLDGAATLPGIYPQLLLYVNPESNPIAAHLRMQRNKLLWTEYGTVVPTLQYTVEETQEYSSLFTDIDDYIKNYTAQVITGEISLEDTWDSYLATLKDMRVDDLITIYQNAYERAIAD